MKSESVLIQSLKMFSKTLLGIMFYSGRTYAKLDIAKINDQVNQTLHSNIPTVVLTANLEKFYLAVEDLDLCISTGTELTGLESRGYEACYDSGLVVDRDRNIKPQSVKLAKMAKKVKTSKISKLFEFVYNRSSFLVKNSHGKCLQGRPNTIPCGDSDGKSSNFDAEPILRNFKPEVSEVYVNNYLTTFENCNAHLPQQKWLLTNGTFYNDECESGAQLIFQVPGVLVTATGFDAERKSQNGLARDVYRLDARKIPSGRKYDGKEKLLV